MLVNNFTHPVTLHLHTCKFLHLFYSLDPYEGVVVFRVNGFQVLNGQLLVQHLLVEGHAKTVVNELPMEESLTAERERECTRHFTI